MPPSIKNRNTAPKLRKGAERRKNKPITGCPGRVAAESAPAVIAHSVFALTLKPKGGAEVLISKSTDTSIQKEIEAVYDDLYLSFTKARELFASPLKFNPIKYLPVGTSTDYLIRNFEEIMPAGVDYKITENCGDYQFTIYKQCPSYDEWSVFEICHVVRILKKNYPRLLDLFLIFLNTFHSRTGIDLWYGDTISYASTWIQDSIDERKEEYENGISENVADRCGWDQNDEDQYLRLLKADKDYRIGEPAKYERLITKAKYVEAATIIKMVRRLKREHPVIDLIISGCEFLIQYPYSVNDFDHQELTDYYETGCGLRFDFQQAVLWDTSDEYTARHEEYIDCEAQEGVIPPVLKLDIRNTTSIEAFNRFEKGDDFPHAIHNFFTYANKILKAYAPEN